VELRRIDVTCSRQNKLPMTDDGRLLLEVDSEGNPIPMGLLAQDVDGFEVVFNGGKNIFTLKKQDLNAIRSGSVVVDDIVGGYRKMAAYRTSKTFSTINRFLSDKMEVYPSTFVAAIEDDIQKILIEELLDAHLALPGLYLKVVQREHLPFNVFAISKRAYNQLVKLVRKHIGKDVHVDWHKLQRSIWQMFVARYPISSGDNEIPGSIIVDDTLPGMLCACSSSTIKLLKKGDFDGDALRFAFGLYTCKVCDFLEPKSHEIKAPLPQDWILDANTLGINKKTKEVVNVTMLQQEGHTALPPQASWAFLAKLSLGPIVNRADQLCGIAARAGWCDMDLVCKIAEEYLECENFLGLVSAYCEYRQSQSNENRYRLVAQLLQNSFLEPIENALDARKLDAALAYNVVQFGRAMLGQCKYDFEGMNKAGIDTRLIEHVLSVCWFTQGKKTKYGVTGTVRGLGTAYEAIYTKAIWREDAEKLASALQEHGVDEFEAIVRGGGNIPLPIYEGFPQDLPDHLAYTPTVPDVVDCTIPTWTAGSVEMQLEMANNLLAAELPVLKIRFVYDELDGITVVHGDGKRPSDRKCLNRKISLLNNGAILVTDNAGMTRIAHPVRMMHVSCHPRPWALSMNGFGYPQMHGPDLLGRPRHWETLSEEGWYAQTIIGLLFEVVVNAYREVTGGLVTTEEQEIINQMEIYGSTEYNDRIAYQRIQTKVAEIAKGRGTDSRIKSIISIAGNRAIELLGSGLEVDEVGLHLVEQMIEFDMPFMEEAYVDAANYAHKLGYNVFATEKGSPFRRFLKNNAGLGVPDAVAAVLHHAAEQNSMRTMREILSGARQYKRFAESKTAPGWLSDEDREKLLPGITSRCKAVYIAYVNLRCNSSTDCAYSGADAGFMTPHGANELKTLDRATKFIEKGEYNSNRHELVDDSVYLKRVGGMRLQGHKMGNNPIYAEYVQIYTEAEDAGYEKAHHNGQKALLSQMPTQFYASHKILAGEVWDHQDDLIPISVIEPAYMTIAKKSVALVVGTASRENFPLPNINDGVKMLSEKLASEGKKADGTMYLYWCPDASVGLTLRPLRDANGNHVCAPVTLEEVFITIENDGAGGRDVLRRSFYVQALTGEYATLSTDSKRKLNALLRTRSGLLS
jgi:hypothetical protein